MTSPARSSPGHMPQGRQTGRPTAHLSSCGGRLAGVGGTGCWRATAVGSPEGIHGGYALWRLFAAACPPSWTQGVHDVRFSHLRQQGAACASGWKLLCSWRPPSCTSVHRLWLWCADVLPRCPAQMCCPGVLPRPDSPVSCLSCAACRECASGCRALPASALCVVHVSGTHGLGHVWSRACLMPYAGGGGRQVGGHGVRGAVRYNTAACRGARVSRSRKAYAVP